MPVNVECDAGEPDEEYAGMSETHPKADIITINSTYLGSNDWYCVVNSLKCIHVNENRPRCFKHFRYLPKTNYTMSPLFLPSYEPHSIPLAALVPK